VTSADLAVRSRAVSLLRYLDGVRQLKEAPARDIAEYNDKRWWAGDIPDHPSCVVTQSGEGPWLRVAKAQVPPPPPVPEKIVPYLVTRVNDPAQEPTFAPDFDQAIADELEEADREEAEQLAEQLKATLREHVHEPWIEHLKAMLREYIDGPWREWAAKAQQARKARALYDDLFDLRLRLQRDSSFIELVWGHAVLSWTVSGTRVVHPLVTTQVELAFDVETGTIAVTPEAFAAHQMDIDLLQGLKLSGFDVLIGIRDGFRAAPVGPFDPEARELYERLLGPLGQDGQVIDARTPQPPGETPAITACWVLMVRRRSTMYRRFFGGLREALEDEQADVPAPLVAVVADEPGKLDLDAAPGDGEAWRRSAERLLMPLPVNPEQEAVAKRLALHRGVTVQGPPGTGKTHTIANLISHLVGHGKRVLVTSQKEQALSVLRDKIPEPLRDLSVAVLGSSAASMGQLEQSTQAIYENAVGLDRDAARSRVTALEGQLTAVQREIGLLRTRIAAGIARERDDSYVIAGVTLSPSSVGRWLAEHEAALGYIPDALCADKAFPLTAAETADLFHVALIVTVADRAAARLRLPSPADLASSDQLIAAKSELREIRNQLAMTDSSVQDRVALERLSPDDLRALIDGVDQAVKRVTQLEEPWLLQIRRELRDARFVPGWREQMKAVNAGIQELTTVRNQLSGHDVRLPDGEGLPGKELIDQLHRVRDQLESGRGISKTFQKKLYQAKQSCLVDFEPPRSAADVELCLAQARILWLRYELVRRWNDAAGRVSAPRVDPATSHPEYELAGYADALGDAFSWETGAWDTLRARLQSAGVRVPLYPESAELAALADTLRTAALHVREKDLRGQLDAVRESLVEGGAQPQASDLWRGLLAAFTGNSWREWDRLVDEARRVGGLVADVARFDRLTARLSAEAPIWAARLTGSTGDPAVVGSADTAASAWEWRQAETWLRAIIASDDPAALQDHLEAKLGQASAITSDLAAESAWLGLSERLTDADRRALTAWTQAMRRVGKGTGKYAPRFRAEAQKAMREAQAAVPVWIMPTHRVVESFDPLTTRFDVVIVDESSQCDLFGLAALSVADRAVIVGDDKQISPQAIGTDESAVHDLLDQHLSKIPQYRLLDIKTSIYDLAKMRFPGVIMLREHFRCLPDIIDFSNQLSYNGQILPLREQPADESWQSVVDKHILDGFREPGTDTNEAEAEFIVNKIAELCEDPRYDGMTFGVISLLGDGQANLIQGRLVERLGEKEVERRRIRCGNAYHFQGDERHVVFLSMVVTTGEGRRLGAMTREADRQRINVAASRAQDQLWCVRSIGADELHPDDVRGQLIRYCQNPARVRQAVAEEAASFDSDFERDVYRQIVARGYLVKTQFKVGRYRIDLVVEGKRGRLAVELDGDAYHGPDRAEADQRRQMILERLGWTFHRIRGSAFYRDPDGALSGLWDRLGSLEIEPVPSDNE
jgi:very-short-patch-repair endonuclease